MNRYPYEPDYAVAPGRVVAEHLETLAMTQAELALRCGRSAKLISDIVNGKAPIEPATALQLERIFGLKAGIWLRMEAAYRLFLEREKEEKAKRDGIAWAKEFPVSELVRRGKMVKPESQAARLNLILSFFGVASIEAWKVLYAEPQAAFRQSAAFQSDLKALAVWLRLGELQAMDSDCRRFSKPDFLQALRDIRRLTRRPVHEALQEAVDLCSRSGVALLLVPPLPGTRLSGAARWLGRVRGAIQLSGRHKSHDHLWFTFFHEAAHLILHRPSWPDIFMDEDILKGEGEQEEQANAWAADFLIPGDDWRSYTGSGDFSQSSVVRFACEMEIAPGIVAGRLQHEQFIHWSELNELKERIELSEVSG